jgi:hypothetical protein
LVVRGDADPDLLKLVDVWRRGSLRVTRTSTLLVDLLPHSVAAEGVPRALVIGARYVEMIAAGTRLGLKVVKRLLSPRLDMEGLGCLADVGVAGWSQTEGEGLAMRRGLH